MKKILCLCLIGVLCFALVGCGNKDNDNNNYNNENNNTNNGNNNNEEQNANQGGRLVSNVFSIKYPESWEFKMNDGDPEAHDPNSNAGVQLSVMGMPVKDYCKAMRRDDPVDVKVGSYTFQTCGGGAYYYERNEWSIAIISFFSVDDTTREEILLSFKITQ